MFYESNQSLPGDQEPVIEDSRQREWFPFRDAADYAMAEWLSQNKITKGAIDDFCTNPLLEPLSQYTSFRNGEEFKHLIEHIDGGVLDDNWEIYEFTRLSEIEGIENVDYRVYYRDVIKAVRFLIGHEPFADSLAYAPIRNYSTDDPQNPVITDNDERIYSEMHTADWWWETQEKLDNNATIIPLILASDKTMLTKLSGDQSLWPVYLTIGNLDMETRRQRARPSIILLGLIPIPQESGPAAKSENYHIAMEAMLKRKLPLCKHLSTF